MLKTYELSYDTHQRNITTEALEALLDSFAQTSTTKEMTLENVLVSGVINVLTDHPDYLSSMRFSTLFSGSLTVTPEGKLTDTALTFEAGECLKKLTIRKR